MRGIMRNNLRKYGRPPFSVATVHGGPGAGGEMAPVARALASEWNILEPIQTAESLEGQVQELKDVLETHGVLPITLVGFSWGAWLSYIVAARYPLMIKKLILIGSGPYKEEYVSCLQKTRLSRLSLDERTEFTDVLKTLEDTQTKDKDRLLDRLGILTSKSDTYDPIKDESTASDSLPVQGNMFQKVWEDASNMRKSGMLLELGKLIVCPVIAIHGDYDPHPAEGVRVPLSGVLKNFRFILLKNCGHKPWIERYAREEFYEVLRQEIHEKDIISKR